MSDTDPGAKFVNFDIRIGNGKDGEYPVTADVESVGKESGVLKPIASDVELLKKVEALEITRSSNAETRKAISTRKFGRKEAPEPVESVAEPDAKDLGRRLFEALMCVPTGADGLKGQSSILQMYRSSVAVANSMGKGLRIRLRIQAPELAGLPWEYLYDDDRVNHLCLSPTTPFIRYPEEPTEFKQTAPKPPLRILGMISSPSDVAELDVEAERKLMEEAIAKVKDKNIFKLEWLDKLPSSGSGQTVADLMSAMQNEGPWHIFHFIGHGGFDEEKGIGHLVLADDDGGMKLLPADRLSNILSFQRDHLRLVVLNSCEGARASDEAKFSSTASFLIKEGLPAVMSMQYEISDAAALAFSRSLYGTIAHDKPLPIDGAMVGVRIAMQGEVDAAEWATPVLYSSATDTTLFSLDWPAALGVATQEAPAQEPPVTDSPPDSPETSLPEKPTPTPQPTPGQTEKGLAMLAERVEEDWIQGVLERSPHAETLKSLGIESIGAMVDTPMGSNEMATDQSITDVFDEAFGSLLILGEPGAGKTTLMLTLVRDLVAAWHEDSSRRLPAVFSLSSWKTGSGDLADWIVSELSNKYQIPEKFARPWLADGRFTLVLDGLDVVRSEHRGSCLDAINEIAVTRAGRSLVVTCRFREYSELAPKRLALGGAVRLQELSRDDILATLEQAGSDLEGLHAVVSKDTAWQVVAETPVLLAMIVKAYKGLSEDDLNSVEYQSIDHRMKDLMKRYREYQFEQAMGADA
ncbi:MAG: CHAT domain-containing protein [Rhodothermia bacterium]